MERVNSYVSEITSFGFYRPLPHSIEGMYLTGARSKDLFLSARYYRKRTRPLARDTSYRKTPYDEERDRVVIRRWHREQLVHLLQLLGAGLGRKCYSHLP